MPVAHQPLHLPYPWLLYADDLVTFHVDPGALQVLLDWLEQCTGTLSLDFNLGKCELMRFGSPRLQKVPLPTITLGGQHLQFVSQLKYLGLMFDQVASPQAMWQDR